MFHLHSFHLDSEIIELDVKLFFHQIGLLLYLGRHLLGINIITADIVEGICRHLVLRISYIFSHFLYFSVFLVASRFSVIALLNI